MERVTAPKRAELLRCWVDTAHIYARNTCEPADTIVDAVFGKCLPYENALGDALVATAPAGKGSGVEAYLDGARSSGRKIILATALDDRASRKNCPH